jgi:PAS domain S-box-containing protein
MTHQTLSSGKRIYLAPRIATAAFAVAIFIADTVTDLAIAVAVLYVAVVLMSARFCEARGVLLVAAGCVGLTILSYFLSPPSGPGVVGVANALLAILAMGLTTVLVLQSQSAEATLREQASLLDLTHDGVFSRSIDGAITYWNHGAAELFGWTKAEALGMVSDRLLEKTLPAPVDQIDAELLRTGRWEGELVCKKRDRTRVVVASRWSLQRDREGRATAVLETNNDITQRKQAEEALQQAQANLERLNRVTLLGEMAAAIAHELNQPLAAVVANGSAGLRWLDRPAPDLSKARASLQEIVRDGHRAAEVIKSIRSLFRVANQERSPILINAVILEALELVGAVLRSERVQVVTDLAADLPMMSASKVQLQQVMLNLVTNAIEAMRPITDRARVLKVSSTFVSGQGVLIGVADTGTGIEPKNVDGLFDAFFTTKPDGTGMGLAICRSIVEAHGGQLSAAPNEPHGAVFRFMLPVEDASSPHSVALAS